MTDKKPPAGLGVSGRALWRAITAAFELDEHELTLLREAARTVDLLDALEAEVKRAGAVVDSPQGRKANPAAVEARQQRLTLARLLVALRIPAEEARGVAVLRPGRSAACTG